MNEPVTLPEGLMSRTERLEGFSATPYRCPAGFLTVGFGHNLDVPMSREEARALLSVRLHSAARNALSVFPELRSYGEPRAMALIDMVFNLGLSRFRTFKRLIAAVRLRDWEWAAREIEDSDYYTQTGNRARENAAVIRTGRFDFAPFDSAQGADSAPGR